MVYKPTVLQTLDFAALAYVLGDDGKTLNENRFEIPINVRGVSSPVKISANHLNFETFINRDGDENPAQQVCELANTSTDTIKWNSSFTVELGESEAFTIEPNRGVLEKGNVQIITVTYNPQKPGGYLGKLYINILHPSLESALTVSLKGKSMYPTILFDPPEVFLPISPVGIESRSTVSIINVGCGSGDINPVIPMELRRSDVFFDLFFPEGNFLANDRDRLSCVLRFIATQEDIIEFKPVGFTVKIPFEDTEKNRFYLTVHGTSDCSSLTLLPFLWSQNFQPQEGSPRNSSENQKRYQSINEETCAGKKEAYQSMWFIARVSW